MFVPRGAQRGSAQGRGECGKSCDALDDGMWQSLPAASQNNFIRIDRLMVVVKTSPPLNVTIGGTGGARVIDDIR